MSISTEHKELQRRRAQLESELQSFDEKERTIGTSLRILEEKVEIKELEEKVKAKRAVVERLESKKRDLANRLKEPHS